MKFSKNKTVKQAHALTVRFEKEDVEKAHEISNVINESLSFVVRTALSEYVNNVWSSNLREEMNSKMSELSKLEDEIESYKVSIIEGDNGLGLDGDISNGERAGLDPDGAVRPVYERDRFSE